MKNYLRKIKKGQYYLFRIHRKNNQKLLKLKEHKNY
jgi:hypothetical protein